jgi:hypothetical protein
MKRLTVIRTLHRQSHLARLLLASLIVLAAPENRADEFSDPPLTHSATDFGGIGLMQMPTARMMPEGGFSLGVTNNDEYIHYNVALQLFPWFEANIRYTQVHDVLYSNVESFSGGTDYTDKSFDAKLGLLEESYWRPQVAVGFRDIGGTGLFDSEYIVASKNFGPMDLTLGVAWGYLGNSGNLYGKDGTADCGREAESQWGEVALGRMFSGCAAVFGGIEYQTPLQPLRLKLEYDSNNYRSDFPVTRGNIDMPVSTPWNVGLVYSLTDWADVRLSYERGNTFTAGLTLQTNLATLRPNFVDDPRPAYQPADARQDLSPEAWQKLTQDLGKVAGYQQAVIYQDGDTVIVKGEQTKYRDRREAERRAALLLANTGINANSYRIINTSQKQPVTETRINAKNFARVADRDYPNASLKDARKTGNPVAISGQEKAYEPDRWQYGISPHIQQSFGGSEDFYLYAIGINANAYYRAGDHWLLSGELYGNLVDNYDKFKYTVPPDGTDLKRVRTLNRQYFERTVRVDRLQVNYFDRLTTNLYGQAYGGYLETMFAGVGSEVLYRPLNKNWAVGVDANYVKQREPDTTFDLYSEETHVDPQSHRRFRVQTGTGTGHVTFYWQPQFWSLIDDTLLKVSAGRYLSEDLGMTIDFSKRFNSGVIAGAFITKTDLSADEYGEGSYTKGFYISIPLDLLMVKPTLSRANISWLPLQRDGGQMLDRRYDLYGLTDARAPWFTKAAGE